MLNKYPKNVKIVFKHFPLNNHRLAASAALASVAAMEQGKFWQYHDMIFAKAQELANENFREFALKLNLNMALFDKSMNSQESRDKVIKDHNDGVEATVTGTPTVFINGRKLRDRSIEGFQKIIDEELQKNL